MLGEIINLALSAYVCSYALEENEPEEDYYEIYEEYEFWPDEIHGGDQWQETYYD